MVTPPLSAELARFVTDFTYEGLSADQRIRIKTYVLDWLGSAYAGGSSGPVRMILDVARDMGGRAEATFIPGGSKGPCLFAALVNGASSHMVEMDDLHRESILHPAAAILPALLAVAERERVTGRDLMVAVALGYEAGIRVALGVGPDHYRRWHTTGTCGTFGAAAGSAKLLRLTHEQTVWALGSAGTQASGLWQFLAEGAMSKQLHPGKAAMNGLLAALLAQKGFTGAAGILEGNKGFFKATSGDFDTGRCLEGLGTVFVFDRNSLKYYASCGHTHSAIGAVLGATRGRLLPPREIRDVEVGVYQAAVDLLGDVVADTPYGAKFNLPFCVATALLYGQALPEDFTEARIRDGDLNALMKRVHVAVDPELNRNYPRTWPARVEIRLQNGETLRGEEEYPKGDPENPLTLEELTSKFRALTRGALSATEAEALMERLLNLEEIADVKDLLPGPRGVQGA